MKKRFHDSVVWGTIAMASAALLIKVIGVMFKVPLSYMLSEEGMGYFNSAYTVYGFFYIISASGTPKAITVMIARAKEGESQEKIFATCRYMLKIFAVFGITITLLFIILASPITQFIGNSRSLYTMVAVAPTIAFVTLSGVIKGYLNGYSRFGSIAVAQVIEAVGKVACGLTLAALAIRMALPLPMISAFAILGIAIGSLLSLIYMYVVCFETSRSKAGDPRDKTYCRKMLLDIIKVALPITISSAIGALSGILDLVLVVNGLRSAGISEGAANAVYGNYSTLAVPMINLASALLTPLSFAILPKLAVSGATCSKFAEQLGHAWKITAMIASPIALCYFLYSYEILDLLFTAQASANGAMAFSVLSVSALLLPLLTLVNTALEAVGSTGKALLSLSLGAVIKLVVSFVLIPDPRFGILGAAIGSIASYLFSLFLSLSFIKKTTHGIKIPGAIIAVALSVICYVPAFTEIYAKNLCSSSALSMIVAIAASSIVYFPVIFIIFWGNGIKTKYHNAQKTASSHQ